MTTTVALGVKTLHCPDAAGVLWTYLNWALGFQALGCDVVWAEEIRGTESPERLTELTAGARARLAPFGLADRLALLPLGAGAGRPPDVAECLPFEAVADADVLINFAYALPQDVLDAFRRTAVVDIDPGLLQFWIARKLMAFGRYDRYFSIGETVGRAGSGIPDLGVAWHHTPPCVALDWWPLVPAPAAAPFTTITHWTGEWMEDDLGAYDNAKRAGFAPFLGLPALTRDRLELAVFFGPWDRDERPELRERGWSVVDPTQATSSTAAYQRYIQESRGEFSCAKPSCARIQNAWVSDRTLCYLASGKPAVVQYTGPSRYLPDRKGMFRFTTLEDAARILNLIGEDYPAHCRDARAVAEAYFDARAVTARVLERALD